MFLKLAFLLLAYLIGSIPSAVWYAKYFHGIDIREHGSGNAGATNSLRVLGKKAGIIVLIFDLIKGLTPVLLSKYFGFLPEFSFIVGIVCVLGHIWSVFSQFKGGKGIATSLGVILAVSPLGAGISILVFIIVVVIFRYVSLASLLAALAFAMFYVFYGSEDPRMSIIASVLFMLLVYTHRGNIKKLMNGTENRFSSKKK